jgi:hypothetical protein
MGRQWREAACWCSALALAAGVLVPFGSGIATATRTSVVPSKLVGQWTRTVTAATWHKYGQDAPAGAYLLVIPNAGPTTFFDPGIRRGFDLPPRPGPSRSERVG